MLLLVFDARWIASVRCPRLVAALAFPQLNIGRQLAARLIPPEHERRIGSLDRSQWAIDMHDMLHVVFVQFIAFNPSLIIEDISIMSSMNPVLCSNPWSLTSLCVFVR
jgi:hypothetical protein